MRKNKYFNALEDFCCIEPCFQYKPDELEDIIKQGIEEPVLMQSALYSFLNDRVLRFDS